MNNKAKHLVSLFGGASLLAAILVSLAASKSASPVVDNKPAIVDLVRPASSVANAAQAPVATPAASGSTSVAPSALPASPILAAAVPATLTGASSSSAATLTAALPASYGAAASPSPLAPASNPMPTEQPAPGTFTVVSNGGGYKNEDPSTLQLPVLMPASSWPGAPGQTRTTAHTNLLILDTNNSTPLTEVQYNTPAMVRAAYQLPATGGTGAIAIVDAFHDANALGDFNVFAKEFGLPQETSTLATSSGNKVFQVVYASGTIPNNKTSTVSDTAGWNFEESLDIEWAHALAPNAKIILVEAASDSFTDLFAAVHVAATLPDVHQVSMSWGAGEFSSETAFDSSFTQTGVTYFASGGDSASSAEYPSHSVNVVSVGGTSLTRNSSGVLVGETAWSGTGHGVSLYETRPSFQNAISTLLGTHRGSNDVAFVADPNTGVDLYDSTPYGGISGWWVSGGTSVGAPCWAAVVNQASVANKAAASSQAENTRLYGNLGNNVTFRDITAGTVGSTTSTLGWDLPTGIGSPLGLIGK